MSGLIGFFEGLTVWHWVGLGIILIDRRNRTRTLEPVLPE